MARPQAQLQIEPISVEEYLAQERLAEERSLYLDGYVYAMAGESPAHGTICTNLTMLIASQLKGSPCQAWSKDFKVRSGPRPQNRRTKKGLYSYPDLVVFCGAPVFHDDHRDVMVEPTVVIEVLSPSTEAFDRGEKFLRYQNWNPTLSDYLLVSQTQPLIEHFVRQTTGGWSYYIHQELRAGLTIQSIACTLNLVDVYDRIEFQSESTEADEDIELT